MKNKLYSASNLKKDDVQEKTIKKQSYFQLNIENHVTALK